MPAMLIDEHKAFPAQVAGLVASSYFVRALSLPRLRHAFFPVWDLAEFAEE